MPRPNPMMMNPMALAQGRAAAMGGAAGRLPMMPGMAGMMTNGKMSMQPMMAKSMMMPLGNMGAGGFKPHG